MEVQYYGDKEEVCDDCHKSKSPIYRIVSGRKKKIIARFCKSCLKDFRASLLEHTK